MLKGTLTVDLNTLLLRWQREGTVEKDGDIIAAWNGYLVTHL